MLKKRRQSSIGIGYGKRLYGNVLRGRREANMKKWIPRIRHGNESSIETLINEEALLLGLYLREERKDWVPRIGITNNFGSSFLSPVFS